MIPPFALILTAAGSSQRFSDKDVKKEFLKIDGHSVLYRAAEPFFEIPSLSAVVVTTKEGSEDEAYVAMEDLTDVNSIPMLFSKGGETRAESVKKALGALSSLSLPIEFVAIHDGARPYLRPELVINVLAAASSSGGAVPAVPATDSFRRIDRSGRIVELVDRRGLISVQTPQIFRFDELLDAYNRVPLEGVTDDAEVFVKAGFICLATEGDKNNTKITYLEDIPDAEEQIKEYIREREEGRKQRDALRLFKSYIYEGEEE